MLAQVSIDFYILAALCLPLEIPLGLTSSGPSLAEYSIGGRGRQFL